MTMATDLGYEARLALPFEAAIGRVTEALQAEGFGVLTRIDVQETLKKKIGADFRPYVILGACNPRLAHKALTSRSEVGLMLPCNVTVEFAGEAASLVRIADPAMMMTVGELGSDVALQEVSSEARARLTRVVESLRKA
jgi:uncharacterized protein (DUF302 family)